MYVYVCLIQYTVLNQALALNRFPEEEGLGSKGRVVRGAVRGAGWCYVLVIGRAEWHKELVA